TGGWAAEPGRAYHPHHRPRATGHRLRGAAQGQGPLPRRVGEVGVTNAKAPGRVSRGFRVVGDRRSGCRYLSVLSFLPNPKPPCSLVRSNGSPVSSFHDFFWLSSSESTILPTASFCNLVSFFCVSGSRPKPPLPPLPPPASWMMAVRSLL